MRAQLWLKQTSTPAHAAPARERGHVRSAIAANWQLHTRTLQSQDDHLSFGTSWGGGELQTCYRMPGPCDVVPRQLMYTRSPTLLCCFLFCALGCAVLLVFRRLRERRLIV